MANETHSSDRDFNDGMKRATLLDKAVARVLSTVDPSYTDRRLMTEQDAEFQKVIDRQLDLAKGVAGTQIVDFIASIKAQQEGKRGKTNRNSYGVDTADLFTQNVGDIFSYFQDVHKNRFMEVSDLKFISKFIPALGESVRIYLDAIVSSDDVSETITRNIIMPSVTENSKYNELMDVIKNLEKQHNLQQKLKVAYRKTLVTGTFYVYHISYAELFGMYSRGLAEGKITKDGPSRSNARLSDPSDANSGKLTSGGGRYPKMPNVLGIAQESEKPDPILEGSPARAMPEQVFKYEPAFENFGEEMQFLARDGFVYKANLSLSAMESEIDELAAASTMPRDREGNQEDPKAFAKKLKESLEADLPNVYFVDSPVPFDVIDDTAAAAIEGFNEFFNLRKDVDEKLHKNDTKVKADDHIPDGTYDVSTSHKRGQNFDSVPGTYLKWIDYKYVIPIDVLGQRVGYYHIVTTPKNRKKGRGQGVCNNEIGGILSTGSMSLFDQMDVSEKRKEVAIQNIVDTISNSILDQFSVKFVRKNAAFKQLIAECIIANGLVDNDFMIQFIPVENMIEFKCNEDENGHGESILSEAMFPAHLLLSIVICKMLNYINKGGNRTIAHISSGKVTKSLSNQVNRVIRDLQASDVTFTDLLSSSMVFSKVTRDSNVAMPKDLQGNRLVEFEVQEGQDINLNTDYESMLERWCMMATGMPPTVMDYESNVEVAKKVVSDNIRVAGRVASLQSDFESPTTKLYRVLIEDSDLSEQDKNLLQGTLEVKLPRPRILANQNNSEALNTAYQNAQVIANVKVGESAQEPADQRVKEILTESIVREEVPFLDWSHYDDLLNKAKAAQKEETLKKQTEAVINKGNQTENPDDALSDMPGMGNDEETPPEEPSSNDEDLDLNV